MMTKCTECKILKSEIRRQIDAFKAVTGLTLESSSTILVQNLEELINKEDHDMEQLGSALIYRNELNSRNSNKISIETVDKKPELTAAGNIKEELHHSNSTEILEKDKLDSTEANENLEKLPQENSIKKETDKESTPPRTGIVRKYPMSSFKQQNNNIKDAAAAAVDGQPSLNGRGKRKREVDSKTVKTEDSESMQKGLRTLHKVENNDDDNSSSTTSPYQLSPNSKRARIDTQQQPLPPSQCKKLEQVDDDDDDENLSQLTSDNNQVVENDATLIIEENDPILSGVLMTPHIEEHFDDNGQILASTTNRKGILTVDHDRHHLSSSPVTHLVTTTVSPASSLGSTQVVHFTPGPSSSTDLHNTTSNKSNHKVDHSYPKLVLVSDSTDQITFDQSNVVYVTDSSSSFPCTSSSILPNVVTYETTTATAGGGGGAAISPQLAFFEDGVQYYIVEEEMTESFGTAVQAIVINHENIKHESSPTPTSTYSQLRNLEPFQPSPQKEPELLTWAQVHHPHLESSYAQHISTAAAISCESAQQQQQRHDEERSTEVMLYEVKEDEIVYEEDEEGPAHATIVVTTAATTQEEEEEEEQPKRKKKKKSKKNSEGEGDETTTPSKKSKKKKRGSGPEISVPSEGRLVCTVCDKNFKNKNTLYNHRSIYHRAGGGPGGTSSTPSS